MLTEFTLIARHLAPLAGEGALGLQDDAAVLTPPPGRQLVISADAMVEGVHFLPDDPPATIGRKLLRANLSDLAAMGAAPLGYLLTLALPQALPEAWLAAFAAGLALDQAAFGIALLGGDTTATPGPVSLSATVLGHVAPGTALRRGGARAGDGVWVTGTLGDGALGLRVLRGALADASGFLVGRYRLPQPRLALGMRLAGIASAAMDVSDGLVQDLGHLCQASGVGAVIEAGLLPQSAAASALGVDITRDCLTGGDDYELLLAVSPAREVALAAASQASGIPVTCIGRCVEGSGVQVLDARGMALAFGETGGWQHFRAG